MKLFTNLYKEKTILITESQAIDLLFESATIQDIYQKYYSQIPQDIFQQIISADPTYNIEKPNKMGKFGKWLLTLYQKQNIKIEDLYKAKEYLSTFIKFNAKLQQKDIMKYHSLTELYKTIEPFLKNPQQAATKAEEIRNIKEGAEKVYEDGKWLVVVPHTQEASCYYGKGTQWCTAAEHSHNMFNSYNKYGPLYINILKGTNTKYQFHFETQQFMDANDKPIQIPIANTIGLTNELVNFYANKYEINAISLTTNYVLDDLNEIKDLKNYYIDKDLHSLLMYNPHTKQMQKLYEIKDYSEEFCMYSKMGRFIPISIFNKYINIYDIQNKKLLFNEEEYDYFNIDGNYLIVNFNDDNKGIYSLEQMKYTTTSLPENCIISRINSHYRDAFKYYNNDMAIITLPPNGVDHTSIAFAPFSFSKGDILSQGFYKTTKREGIYANGKLYEFVSFIKGNDEYNDADILLYDGTLIPLPQLAQNADNIITNNNIITENLKTHDN